MWSVEVPFPIVSLPEILRFKQMSKPPGQVDRVVREREAYNEGLQREGYESLFAHTHALYEMRRLAIIKQIFQPYEAGKFLELGSNVWLHWLEENDLNPGELNCINISEAELSTGISAATGTRLKPKFFLMDAHRLAFPDQSMDVVYGGGILHHLDFEVALKEIHRVLKPGGVMYFREPLDINPVGKIVRLLTPRARTVDERPLKMPELALLKASFEMQFYFEQLLTVPMGVISRMIFKDPDNILTRAAFNIDESLVRWNSKIGRYFREVMIVGRKPI